MEEISQSQSFKCNGCGAELHYEPGTTQLKCPYCGTTNEIAQSEEEVEELDYHAALERAQSDEDTMVIHTVKCENCGAESTLDPNVQSANCAYCDTPLVVEQAHDETVIRPRSVLPFKTKKELAIENFRKWIRKGFWVPNKLKRGALQPSHFKGMYLPFWTYDSDTVSRYKGKRGEHYYVEVGSGDDKRRERRTRWYPASGTVRVSFDDVLIEASTSVPKKHSRKLEPWDLENLAPFDNSYLSGYTTERYQVGLEQGFGEAKGIMADRIERACLRDIGGDEQRVTSVSTRYDNLTFKHILLPVYLSAYRYKDKLYQFFVNARTGEVQGSRPVSATKVAIAIGLGIVVVTTIALIYWFTQETGPGQDSGPILP